MNTPNPNESDKADWIAQARVLLDESIESIDAATLSRLNRARQAALATRARSNHPWLLSAGLASACALLLAAAVWMPRHGVATRMDDGHADTIATQPSGGTEAGDSLADDSPEFYQDLEFYAWLDAQHKDGAG